MARSISLSLSLSKTHRFINSLLPSPTLLSSRSQSSHRRGDLHEIDTASSPSDALVQKLEDAVYRISARRAAPDWLPFVPGSSYWVPPPGSESHSRSIAQLVAQMANPLNYPQKPISSNTTTNNNSSHGWPSSDYFLKGVQPQVMETESHSEEEEG